MDICLATLSKATEQQIFDTVAPKLLRQGSRSFDYLREACAYRDNSGRKCAAGFLIADDEYQKEFDAIGDWKNLVYFKKVPMENEHFIAQLQTIHDKEAVGSWKKALLDLAKKRNLNADSIADA